MYQYNKKNFLGIKITTGVLIFSFLFSSLILLPQKANAAVPTFEINPAIVNSEIATAAGTNILVQKETIWDVAAYVVKQAVITTVLNSITSWAQSGFEGGPSFVQDPEAFLRDVGDQAAGSFIQEVAPFLCEPFKISVISALSLSSSGSISNKISCTLTDVVGNIDNFVNGDFSEGGMDGWFSMTQNKGNNPYDIYATAQMGIHLKMGGQQAKELQILDFGRGFLSSRDCEVQNSHTEYDSNGNPIVVTDPGCAKWGAIKTPGAVIETQINHSLGSGARQLEIADEINETIAAVASALITKVITGLSN